MPRTDINDDRSLSRLQGIDLREHGDSNTAIDCVNVHLNNASRLTNFHPPTMVKAGGYTFACESKDPAAQEFELSLSKSFGLPTVTLQAPTSDKTQVKLTGNNLLGNVLVVLVDEEGHCIESGLDFDVSKDGDSLVLDILWSDFGNYKQLVIKNAYGWATIAVDPVIRTNKTLYVGDRFKLGIDSENRNFCIWEKGSDSWNLLASWGSSIAKPWIEGPTLDDKQESGICLTNGSGFWSFSALEEGLCLKIAPTIYEPWGRLVNNSEFMQKWGQSGGSFNPTQEVSAAETYAFGEFATYRFRAGTRTLYLEMKSDSTADAYDIILTEWNYA